ncbi:MAG: peptide chain release factor N(5)-glutamine methyltransferase [Bernardetiaceae bacterium]|nr:peptide chain release factor N(5)-glutamine methyltransferase [Bernardetiaceae bacterium]
MSTKKLITSLTSALRPYYESREAQNIAFVLAEVRSDLSRQDYVLDTATDWCVENFAYELDALRAGKPLQYILGEAYFYGMRLSVSPSALIPRPETEELVHLLLTGLDSTKPYRILDIGTGSGCIAIALAKHLPQAEVWACDISAAALALAVKNAGSIGVFVRFFEADVRQSDCFLDMPMFDVVVSNPPYIPIGESSSLSSRVKNYEPAEALYVSNEKPLLFYELIAVHARSLLKENGLLAFECHADYAEACASVLSKSWIVRLYQDFQEKNRMLLAQKHQNFENENR